MSSGQHQENLSRHFVAIFQFLNDLIPLQLSKIPPLKEKLESVEKEPTRIEGKDGHTAVGGSDEGVTPRSQLDADYFANIAAAEKKKNSNNSKRKKLI